MRTIAFALVFLPGATLADVTDFEDADLGVLPPGWISSMTHEGRDPAWQIARDPTSLAGEKVLAQLSMDGTSQRFPLAILGSSNLKDGSLTVRFKPVSGRVDQAAGLVWRYRNENNYYLVRANALEDNVVLYKVQEGKRVPLAPVAKQGEYGEKRDVPSGEWHTLAVAFRGARFVVSFDDVALYEVDDPTFSDAGRTGLWTKADSVTYFDDFEVSPAQ